MRTFTVAAPRAPEAGGRLQNLVRWLVQATEKHSQARIQHTVPNYQLRRLRRERLQSRRALLPNAPASPLRAEHESLHVAPTRRRA
jgi:hypothetical protein